MYKKRKMQEINRIEGRLTAAQIETIRKDNPFREERNKLIRSLVLRGVQATLLAAVSGLSDNAIYRIVEGEVRGYVKKDGGRKTVKIGENTPGFFLRAKLRAVQKTLNRAKAANNHFLAAVADLQAEFERLCEKTVNKNELLTKEEKHTSGEK